MKTIFFIVLGISILGGCATAKSNIVKPYAANNNAKLSILIEKNSRIAIPIDQYNLLESAIKEGLQQKQLLTSIDDSNHSVNVNITAYRMRDNAARLTAGAMAGCDTINSVVTVVDNASGEVIGESNIRISECAAWGVAAQVIKKYAKGVVSFLSK